MNLEAKLSPRESQIAKFIALGDTKKEIAGKLFISPRTVENTARNIYDKVQVNSNSQLSVWFFCTRLNLTPAMLQLLSFFFLMLTLTSEFNPTDQPLRARTVRLSGRAKRKENC